MAATMTGHITPEVANIPYNLVVRFFTPDTDTEVHKAAAPTDASGDFTIYGIPAGTYDVGIKAQNTLSLLAEDKVFVDGETTDVDFGAIKGGDLTEDDLVGSSDYTIMSAHYNDWGACYSYAGDWSLPECPSPPPPGGACYGYVIS